MRGERARRESENLLLEKLECVSEGRVIDFRLHDGTPLVWDSRVFNGRKRLKRSRVHVEYRITRDVEWQSAVTFHTTGNFSARALLISVNRIRRNARELPQGYAASRLIHRSRFVLRSFCHPRNDSSTMLSNESKAELFLSRTGSSRFISVNVTSKRASNEPWNLHGRRVEIFFQLFDDIAGFFKLFSGFFKLFSRKKLVFRLVDKSSAK